MVGRQSKILVVEDDAMLRYLMCDALLDAGFDVLDAGSVLEALGLLGCHEGIDVLFSDIDLPGALSGLDLARLFRDLNPVARIFLTSAGHSLIATDMPAHSIFHAKPYDRSGMCQLIADAVAQSDAYRAQLQRG